PPALSIADASVREGNSGTTPVNVTVSVSGASSQVIGVKWATADGSAVAPSDYVSANGTVSFQPGETSKNITVLVNGDLLNEPDENFFVDLSGATGASIARSRGSVTIINDDAVPGLSINDVRVKEGDSGTTDAVFTVTLSAPSG